MPGIRGRSARDHEERIPVRALPTIGHAVCNGNGLLGGVGLLNRIDAILVRIEDGLHFLGCTALVCIAVLINADIFSRMLFRAPVQFQFEMVEFYLMPAVATLSLARVFRKGGHLSLEILHPSSFGSFWPVIRIAMLLLSASLFTALTIMSGRYAAQAFQASDVYFGVIDWPLGWAYLSAPVGCAALTLRLLIETTKRSENNALDAT